MIYNDEMRREISVLKTSVSADFIDFLQVLTDGATKPRVGRRFTVQMGTGDPVDAPAIPIAIVRQAQQCPDPIERKAQIARAPDE